MIRELEEEARERASQLKACLDNYGIPVEDVYTKGTVFDIDDDEDANQIHFLLGWFNALSLFFDEDELPLVVRYMPSDIDTARAKRKGRGGKPRLVK